MKLSAWHCNHDYFSEAARFGSIPGIRLGETHHKLPVVMTGANEIGEAFHFFNWVDCEFDPPQEVRNHAIAYQTHASMSVGDLVEVNDGEAYKYCAPFGWVDVTDHVKGAMVLSGGLSLIAI